MNEVTRIINAIQDGDKHATEELLPLVYEELRLLAAQKMAQEKPGQTLQATALVHEAFIRLVEGSDNDWNSRGHFFMAAAEAMRRILVENARKKMSQKRGGDKRVEFRDTDLPIIDQPEDFLLLDEALEGLTKHDPLVAEIVKLYYFAGLTVEQASNITDISRRTAGKYLAYGRAWLQREISKRDNI